MAEQNIMMLHGFHSSRTCSMHGNEHKYIKILSKPLKRTSDYQTKTRGQFCGTSLRNTRIPRTVPRGVKWPECEAYLSFPFGA